MLFVYSLYGYEVKKHFFVASQRKVELLKKSH